MVERQIHNCNICAHARPTPPRCGGATTGERLVKITAWLERHEATGAIQPGRIVTAAARDCPGYRPAPPTDPGRREGPRRLEDQRQDLRALRIHGAVEDPDVYQRAMEQPLLPTKKPAVQVDWVPGRGSR